MLMLLLVLDPSTMPLGRNIELSSGKWLQWCRKSVVNFSAEMQTVIPGAAQLGRRPTGVAHSKITRVCVLSWPLPMLTSLYFLTVTKY